MPHLPEVNVDPYPSERVVGQSVAFGYLLPGDLFTGVDEATGQPVTLLKIAPCHDEVEGHTGMNCVCADGTLMGEEDYTVVMFLGRNAFQALPLPKGA